MSGGFNTESQLMFHSRQIQTVTQSILSTKCDTVDTLNEVPS